MSKVLSNQLVVIQENPPTKMRISSQREMPKQPKVTNQQETPRSYEVPQYHSTKVSNPQVAPQPSQQRNWIINPKSSLSKHPMEINFTNKSLNMPIISKWNWLKHTGSVINRWQIGKLKDMYPLPHPLHF